MNDEHLKTRSATRYVIWSIVVCALTGCITSPTMLNRAVVRNATSRKISEVMVRHEPTGAIGRVSAILPRAEFDLGFSRQPLKAKRAVVTWTEPTGAVIRVKVVLPRKPKQEEAKTNRTFTLVYTIQPSGEVSVHLQP